MTTIIESRSRPALTSWLVSWLAEEMAVPAVSVDPALPFLSHGLNSIQAMMLVGDLEAALGRSLPPTLAWDHPNIDALAEHLASLDPSAPAPSTTTAPSVSADERELLKRLDDLPDDQIDLLLRQYMS